MKKYNIVTIGGGTGSFTLLSGLKKYPVNISAIVSMADDGGSTGRLRDELGVLPPGDVRQCLVALSEESKTLRELMSYRFENGGLEGHSFGNIFLSALEKMEKSFSGGVKEAAKILRIKGEVIPVIDGNVRMHIKLNNDKIIVGENNLDKNEEIRKIGIKEIFLQPSVFANKEAIKKIKEADLVIIGPGDYFGSIVPNFLARGIPKSLRETKAKIIYVCNLTNKKGQTDNFSLEKYVEEINKLIKKERIDAVIFNNKKINASLIKRYEKREGKNSVVKIENKKVKNYKILQVDLVNGAKKGLLCKEQSFIRHDSVKLARAIMELQSFLCN